MYDDKVNIHRANEVWMLFDRDYSRNNPFVAEIYNSYRLPEKIANKREAFLNANQVIFYFSDAAINYMCDSK